MPETIMREQLVAQLRKSRAQFQFYADNHRAKAADHEYAGRTRERDEALEKAKTNEAMVAEIDGTIGLDDGAGERDMVQAVRSSDVFAPGTLAAIMGDVTDFHRVLAPSWLSEGIPLPLTMGEAEVRAKWVRSEANELVEDTDTIVGRGMTMGSDDMVDLIAKQADAFIDMIYFAAGGLVRMGIDPSPLWDIAHGQNMAKVQPDGTVLRNADGKVIKPYGWVDPHALQVAEIKRQIDAA